MSGGKPVVVVVGSVYADMAIRCVDFPATGQIVTGNHFSYTASGSGFNQAIQAALCGCEVHLVGKVGSDIFGQMIKKNLADFGVRSDFVFEAEAKNTGINVSFVNSSGANRTIISEGANRALQSSDIQGEKFEAILSRTNICLINGGLNDEFVSSAIRAAKLCKTKVILDPALSSEQFEKQSGKLPLDYYTADILVPNFTEAAELSAAGNHNIHTAKLIGSDLIARGAGCVIIKLGKRGALIVDREGTTHIPSFEVKYVERSGCGDAFDGALAASCAAGSAKGCLTAEEIKKAVKFASAAGAIVCSRFGGAESLPKKEEIVALMQEWPEKI